MSRTAVEDSPGAPNRPPAGAGVAALPNKPAPAAGVVGA